MIIQFTGPPHALSVRERELWPRKIIGENQEDILHKSTVEFLFVKWRPPSILHHLIFLPSSPVQRATSNHCAWDTSKLIPSKSTCWWANCIRLICSGHTMPRFDTVLPVIKWWNHQGSALAAGVVRSKDAVGWQINSSSTKHFIEPFLIHPLVLNLFWWGYIMHTTWIEGILLLDRIKISGIFRLYGSSDTLVQIWGCRI